MQTITDYLERCEDHKQVLFRIKKNGKGYYVVNGKEIPKKVYEENNPQPLYIRSKGYNLDGTTNWITE